MVLVASCEKPRGTNNTCKTHVLRHDLVPPLILMGDGALVDLFCCVVMAGDARDAAGTAGTLACCNGSGHRG